MEDLKNTASTNDANLQSIYTKDINEALEWIEAN